MRAGLARHAAAIKKIPRPDADPSRLPPPGIARACAVTIGNFDGVHRGHQAMLALLNNEARHRGVPSCVLTFEPHPRDYFAALHRKPELAPARIATLRDKLTELAKCGVDQCVILKFDARLVEPGSRSLHRRRAGAGPGREIRAGGRRLPLRRQARRRLRDARFGRQPPGLRRRAHEQLRGARPARVELGGARGAGARRHGRHGRAARPAVQHQRPRGPWPQARPRARLQAPSTCASPTGSRPPAASSRCWCTAWATSRWKAWPTSASGPRSTRATSTAAGCCWRRIACNGPPGWATKGPTVKSSAWNCCTNCTTSCVRRSRCPAAGIARDCDAARAFFASTHAETRRQTTRDRI
jgi:riboflavin kinase/FMN adenylyltransferase